MSANLCWEPVPKSSNELPALAPQHTIQILEEIGIRFPGRANVEHIASLRALSKAWSDKKHDPFAALADAIEQYGELRLWEEY